MNWERYRQMIREAIKMAELPTRAVRSRIYREALSGPGKFLGPISANVRLCVLGNLYGVLAQE